MNAALQVFIRNRTGEYLSGGGEHWSFTADRAQAHVFDYHADEVAVQLENAQRDLGIIWLAWPVEENLLCEVCDQCGCKLYPTATIFDGSHFLCPTCRFLPS